MKLLPDREKWAPLWRKIRRFAWENRWFLLLGAVGALLMIWPAASRSAKASPAPSAAQTETDLTGNFEKRLEAILSKVDGVGKVKVMLSLRAGEERVFATDRVFEEQSGPESGRRNEDIKTVLQSSGGSTVPVERMTLYPVFQGAVVVCQGGGKASVALAVMEAVSAVTGLPSSAIRVLAYE